MKWLKRIVDTSVPLSEYRGQSNFWHTCAIGEARTASLTTVVPSLDSKSGDADDDPMDARLQRLGMAFHEAVKVDDRPQALKLYFAIQTRIARLSGLRK